MSYFFRLNLLFLKFIFFLAFLLYNNSTIAQQSMKEWKKSLSNANGQDRIDLIVNLSRTLGKENLPLADSIAREGIALARQVGDSLSMHRIGGNLSKTLSVLDKLDEGLEIIQESMEYFNRNKDLAFDKAKYQLNLASLLIRKGTYVLADSILRDSESYFENKNNLLWKSKVLGYKGFLRSFTGEYDKAINYYREALEIAEELDDNENLSWLKRGLAQLIRYKGNYPEALEMNYQALTLDTSTLSKAACNREIGMIYKQLEDWSSAKKHTKLSIEQKKRLGNRSSLSYSLYDLGMIHYRQLNYGEALKFLEQSLTLSKEYKLDKKTGSTLGAIGLVYYDIGNHEKANNYFDEQLKLAESLGYWEGIWIVYYNRGFYAYEAKKYDEALSYLLKSYQIAKEKKHLPYLLKVNQVLANTYSKLPGEEAKEKFHEAEYYLINDSLSGIQKIKKIGALEQKRQTQLQIDSLNSASQNNSSLSQNSYFTKTKILIWLGSLLLLIVVSYWYFNKFQRKENPLSDVQPLDETKIDQYFKELFTRLDQNKNALDVAKKQPSKTPPVPIYDMTTFLSSNLKTSNDWASFEHYFEKVHKDFFKNLKSTYPSISPNELNICALIKLNLRNKDIAQVIGIGAESVRKALSRLSKKIDVPTNQTLREFILKL